jgi:hypothetical protein
LHGSASAMMPSFYFLSADGIFITDFPLKGLNSGAKIAKKCEWEKKFCSFIRF